MKSKPTVFALVSGAMLLALRLLQNRLGFSADGLMLANIWSILPLPTAVVIAVGFAATSKKRKPRAFDDAFAVPEGIGLALLVVGGFLLLLGSGYWMTTALGQNLRTQVPLLLAVALGVASGIGVLIMVWQWRREEALTVVPLLPLLFLSPILLLWVYLHTSTDPIVARIGLPILAAAAGSLATARLAGFFYQEKDSRLFPALAAVAIALEVSVITDSWLPLGVRAMLLGVAVVLTGFLAAQKE